MSRSPDATPVSSAVASPVKSLVAYGSEPPLPEAVCEPFDVWMDEQLQTLTRRFATYVTRQSQHAFVYQQRGAACKS